MDNVAEKGCKQCGAVFQVGGRGRRPIYCSKRCKQAAFRGVAPTLDKGLRVPVLQPEVVKAVEPKLPGAVTKPKAERLQVARQALEKVTTKGNPFKGVPQHGADTTCNCPRCRTLRGGYA